MVISGHTHQPYVCNVPDPEGQQRLVTSASSFGRLFTETDLKYDTRTNDIVRASVKGTNMVVTRDVAKAADETALIDRYKTLVAPIAEQGPRQDHRPTSPAPRTPRGSPPLGDLIADAQLKDASVVTGGKTPVVAFMNPGGIRADLTYAGRRAEGDGVVTYEEAFTVQPFNNYLVSMDLNGAAHLRPAAASSGPRPNTGTSRKTLQVSAGLKYTWKDGANGPEVTSVSINGVPSPTTPPAPTGSSPTTSSPTVATTSRRSRTAPTSTSAAWTSTGSPPTSRRSAPTPRCRWTASPSSRPAPPRTTDGDPAPPDRRTSGERASAAVPGGQEAAPRGSRRSRPAALGGQRVVVLARAGLGDEAVADVAHGADQDARTRRRAWPAAGGRGRRRCGCRRSSRSPRPPGAAGPG